MAIIGNNPCRLEREYWEWGWIGITTRRKRRPIYEVILTAEIDRTGGESFAATDTHTASSATVLLQSQVPEIEHGKPYGLMTVTYRAEGPWEAYP
jgi:hypothetical protein